MASRWQRRWLADELPLLIEAGVVPPDVADRVRAHYGAEVERGAAVPLFAVLGAALIGLGVIVLLAANWEALTRPLRAGVCFAVLLSAQGVAGYALNRRGASTAWSESTALALALANAAAIALIGQTYQVQGDLRSFLTTWLLLVLLLPYLFDSRAASAVYLVGTAGWLASSLATGAPTLLFWGYFAAGIPYLVVLGSRGEGGVRSAFLAALAVPVVAFAALAGFQVVRASYLIALASLVVGGTYSLGRGDGPERPFYAGPCGLLAGLGAAIGVFALGYEDAWGFVGEDVPWRSTPDLVDGVGAVLVAIAFGALAGFGALTRLRSRDWARALLALFPAIVIAGIAGVEASGARLVGAALANVYGLALGVALALAGIAEADLRRANAGLLLIAALIFARFSDWTLSLTARGVVFIAFGAGFLLLNVYLRRRRSEEAA